jgi:hypothetical protein
MTPLTDKQYYNSLEAPSSTESSQFWDVAARWLGDCQENHPECRVLGHNLYPTRLLDIGEPSGNTVRVVVSAKELPTGAYATLSHRWGDATFIKLTKKSASDLMSGIALENLPLTFQHAVQVARYLKIRYIWIDSMCIFQDEDDKSDWLHEAGLMDQVYSNSYLNISATASRDSSCGLFVTRDPSSQLKPVRAMVRMPSAGGDPSSDPRNFNMIDTRFFDRELKWAPLGRRGWVFQERFLSPRVLHFGSNQLIWECRKETLCERYPKTLPPSPKQHKNFKRLARQGGTGGEWFELVRTYSECQLTYASDKALAISGVAKKMQKIVGDEYVAGLWRRNLVYQLPWVVFTGQQADGSPSTRPLPYRAPTWSWLSVDGIVLVDYSSQGSRHAEILEVDMEYQTAETIGLILRGSITLRGRLQTLQLHLNEADYVTNNYHKQSKPDWKLTAGGRKLLSPFPDDHEFDTYLDVPQSDFSHDHNAKALFLMAIDNNPDRGYADMLLLKCMDRNKAIFHRFGVAMLDTENFPDIWSAIQAHNEDEAGLPCLAYDSERHLHTIILE